MLKNYYSREVITNDNQRMKQTLNSVAAGILFHSQSNLIKLLSLAQMKRHMTSKCSYQSN